MANWWEAAPVVAPAPQNWWEAAPLVDAGNTTAPEAPEAPRVVAPPISGNGQLGPAIPTSGESLVDTIMRGADRAAGTAAQAVRGARSGVADLIGVPVELANAAPMIANLIPGVDGVGPIHDAPVGGMDFMDELLGGFGAIPELREPQDAVERIARRTGRELGATLVPLGGALGAGARYTAQEARQLGPLARMLVEPAVVDPANLIKKELAYGMGAGAGAGAANEMAGAPQEGDNFWSDFLGSLAGVLGVGIGGKAIDTVRNAAGAVLNKPNMIDDIVGQEVADRVINNSTQLAQQFEETGRVDTTGLANQLRTPAPVEEAVPGFRANIGDRSLDPGLQTFAFDTDALRPGAANSRRVANETAVNTRMDQFAPGGDPSQFRSSLSTARDTRIAGAQNDVQAAQANFDRATQGLRSVMTAEGRGADIRAALESASEQARNIVRQAWEPLNQSGQQVDMAPLSERFGAIDETLSVAERRRFRPTESGIPEQLTEPATPPAPSAVLGPDGRPFMRPGTEASGMQPIREVTGLRSALSDAAREAATAGRANEARIINEHIGALDDYLDTALPSDLQAQYNAARDARRDFADRFERPQTATAQTLDRQQGQYRQPNSAVPGKFVQSDEGRIADFEALMREAGNDTRVQGAVRDQVLADVRDRGLLDDPAQLDEYLGRYGTIFRRFPSLRADLGTVGALRRRLDETRGAEKTLQRDLNTPGRSAIASYLNFSDDRTVDAIRTVTNSPQPREAMRELLDAAGNTPEARKNARTALWADIRQTGKMQAPGMTGEDRWNGKKLRDFLNDPKKQAVAEELYADAPEELQSMREVFEALATAEGSGRARAAGSSGTAQALNGKFDPSMTAASLASRARSVNRGVLTPQIAIIDVAATWLRNRSKQVQARAIDTITSQVVNNPGLAADLLERYNPADFQAKRRMLTQKYGVRVTQILNLIDEAENEDPVVDAVMEP